MSSPTHKTVVRRQCQAYRTSLTPAAYARLSRLICHRATTLPALAHSRIVHVYWPDTQRREVDIRPLIMYLRAMGKQIVLPVITRARSEPAMVSVLFESEDRLQANRWGIYEPVRGPEVDRTTIDAVISPALAADAHGTRVGYGGGYYDRYLTGMNTPIICPIYDACVYPLLETEPHDIPVQVLVSESETIDCAAPLANEADA